MQQGHRRRIIDQMGDKGVLAIDESGFIKKGRASVGVSRQYCGRIGKVDNCQVGVYASLVNSTSASIINERILKELMETNCYCQNIQSSHGIRKTRI